jgi:hypothetical protein
VFTCACKLVSCVKDRLGVVFIRCQVCIFVSLVACLASRRRDIHVHAQIGSGPNNFFLTGATAGLRQPEQLYRNKGTGDHYKCFGGRRETGTLEGFKADQTHYTNY